MSSYEIDGSQTIIAVMGTTGVGKSTFINYATGGNAKVGNELKACTSVCSAYRVMESDVWLIDTPGFDDTFRTDAQILEEINKCLSLYFHKHAKVKGVLYVHAITEPRMRGSAMTNLRMFKNVVGIHNMRHCRLVTTKWSRQHADVSMQRIDELASTDEFWKPLVKRGATIVRFDDSHRSAIEIIRPLAEADPFIMDLVREYNVEGRDLCDTGAGREVFDDIEAAKKAHREEMAQLRREWEEAAAEKDEEMKREIERERRRLDGEIRAMQEGQELLRKRAADEKEELIARMEADRVARQRDRDMKKKEAWKWAARFGAVAVGGAAVVVTAGAALPAAGIFVAAVDEIMSS